MCEKDKLYIFVSCHGQDLSTVKHYITPIQGSISYWGLNYHDSIVFCNLCKSLCFPILGGDVYISQDNRILLTDNHWFTDRQKDEDCRSYLLHSIEYSISYIERIYDSYKRHDCILFSFVVDENR